MSRAPNLIVFDVDIVGPFKLLGPKGEAYFLTITDRGSRCIQIYAIKHKGDAYNVLVSFFKIIKTQFEVKIKAFKLDNAKEFKSNKFTLFCNKKGTLLEYTSPYLAPQNGIAERLNKYIVERLITIYKNKYIPLFLQPIFIEAIIYVKNRTYNLVVQKTPYKELLNKKPNIKYFKVLESLTYTLILKETRLKGKIVDKANRGIFISYKSDNNFLVYLLSNNKIISTKNLTIKEELNYKEDYLKEVLEEDYSSLLKYLNKEDFDKNKEPKIIDLKG